MPTNYVCEITANEREGCVADPAWLKQQHAANMACPSCKHVLADRMNAVREVMVDNDDPIVGHLSAVSDYYSPNVLSEELISAIGEDRLYKIGWFLPVVGPSGSRFKTHRAFMGHSSPGLTRGPSPHEPHVCCDCLRPMYWPGWPPSKWYLLSRYWNPSASLMLIRGELISSADFYDMRIKPRGLRNVSAYRIKIVETPTDGLPADYDEFVAELKRRPAK